MKLIRDVELSATQRARAFTADQAVGFVEQALLGQLDIEGLGALRASLPVSFDSEVLDQVERGEWWLIRAPAEEGHWLPAEPAFNQAVLDLMHNPPAQPSRSPKIFRLVASVTGEPLGQQAYVATVDGHTGERRTNGLGIAHLFTQAPTPAISMRIINQQG